MQIILLEKIANLGELGDVVNVKDGFGRNYLIPQGKAKRATDANKAEFETKRVELEKAQATHHKAAEKRAKDIDGAKVESKQKAGIDGKLFGSVSNIDIAELLVAAGHKVEKSEIRMPDGPIKNIGEFEVSLALHQDVTAKIMVNFIADDAE
jgi:large subunit ribosomal protein L9